MVSYNEMGTIRALSLNIHKGFSHFNMRYILDEIRGFIRETNADVVFLQEVKGFDEQSAEPSAQFEFLADSVWQHFAYGKNAIFPDRHHGNAILSKFPIEHWHNLNLSTNRLEQRGMLQASLQFSSGVKLECFTLHLNLMSSGRLSQVEQVIAYISGSLNDDQPLILAGDFNDWDEQLSSFLNLRIKVNEAFETLHGRSAKTFPSFLPLMRLDRIYYRGLKPLKAECLSPLHWTRSSDHLALLVEFEHAG